MMKFLRENWDIGFIVTAIGMILGWALFLCLVSPLLGQTAPRGIVTWDNLPGAVSWNVKRGTSAATLANVGTSTDEYFIDETLDPTVRYWFGVAGIDSQAREGFTGMATNNPFRFSDIQPASPTSLVCSQTRRGNRVTLDCSWGVVTKTRSLVLLPSGSVVSYRIFMANTGTIQTFNSTITRIVISDVKRHQTFYIYVTAIWNGIESLGSPANRQQT